MSKHQRWEINLQWHSPYTQPPEGWPRTYIRCHCYRQNMNAAVSALHLAKPSPRGYTIICRCLPDGQPVRRPDDQVLAARQKRKLARLNAKFPLFPDIAGQLFNEALAKDDYLTVRKPEQGPDLSKTPDFIWEDYF